MTEHVYARIKEEKAHLYKNRAGTYKYMTLPTMRGDRPGSIFMGPIETLKTGKPASMKIIAEFCGWFRTEHIEVIA